MTGYRYTWALKERHIEPHGDRVSAIGLRLTYPDRECDLSIRISPPLDGKTPETEAAMAELTRLRDALDHILSAHGS